MGAVAERGRQANDPGTWEDVERAALTDPVLRHAVHVVRAGEATREEALILAALFLVDWRRIDLSRRLEQLRTAVALPPTRDEVSFDELWLRLETLVQLARHYAALLNMHDGGARMIPDSAEQWVGRMRALDEQERRRV